MGPDKRETQPGYYLTGQVIAAYLQVRLWPTHQLVGVARCRSLSVATPLSGLPASTAGERLAGALHLALFEQPGKDDFFSSLLGSGEDHREQA